MYKNYISRKNHYAALINFTFIFSYYYLHALIDASTHISQSKIKIPKITTISIILDA